MAFPVVHMGLNASKVVKAEALFLTGYAYTNLEASCNGAVFHSFLINNVWSINFFYSVISISAWQVPFMKKSEVKITPCFRL